MKVSKLIKLKLILKLEIMLLKLKIVGHKLEIKLLKRKLMLLL